MDVVDLRGAGRRRGRRAASGGAAANCGGGGGGGGSGGGGGGGQRRRTVVRSSPWSSVQLILLLSLADESHSLSLYVRTETSSGESGVSAAPSFPSEDMPLSEGRRGIFDGGGGVCRSARSSSVSSVAYSAGSMAANCPQRGKKRVAPKAE